jgi:ATP-dependent exoDNAse (exonuclease V) beta subunit
MGQSVANTFEKAGVPFTWLRDSQSKRNFDGSEDSVKLITMHSSKGLEFPTVATCGVGSLGVDAERRQEEAKLLYVAMTRATENLLVTSSKPTPFSRKLQAILDEQAGSSAA